MLYAFNVLSNVGVIGAVLDLIRFNFDILDVLSNHASPDSGILNRFVSLLSNCSTLFSKYKNDGNLTVVVASSVSAIVTVTSLDDDTMLWLIAVRIFTALLYSFIIFT